LLVDCALDESVIRLVPLPFRQLCPILYSHNKDFPERPKILRSHWIQGSNGEVSAWHGYLVVLALSSTHTKLPSA
jgi:hypothetical protein